MAMVAVCKDLGDLALNFSHQTKSGGGPPHSRTLARILALLNRATASWTAPALWRFDRTPKNVVTGLDSAAWQTPNVQAKENL
jgi:hypothetical protein